VRLFVAQEVRELDQKVIQALGGRGEVLMELAGSALARSAIALSPRRVFVLCGGGNNGGDGYVTARWLRQKGVDVRVFAVKPPDRLRGEARWAYESYLQTGGQIAGIGENLSFVEELTPGDLVVDAILGTGVTSPLAPEMGDYLSRLSSALKDRGVKVLACDLPSGIHPDTGELLAPPMEAVKTVTMGAPKVGLYSYPARKYCGEIEVVDLGYPQPSSTCRFLLTPEHLPRIPRPSTAHKGSFGTVGVLGGSKGMPGALALVCTGALRAGAGKVIAMTEEGGEILLPPEGIRRTFQAHPHPSFLEGLDVVVCGPGIGRDKGRWSTFRDLLMSLSCPLILDADFLWMWGESSWEPFSGRSFLITPHEGEAGRLLGVAPEKVRMARLPSALELAKRTGGIVLLKGPGTIITDGERVAISPFATHRLAIPGSGDLLCGVIAGLCAQGIPLWESALLGVYAHARAGLESPLPLGNLASELASAIPRILGEFLDE
jgi:NAD(P)H-hydrate epimerase